MIGVGVTECVVISNCVYDGCGVKGGGVALVVVVGKKKGKLRMKRGKMKKEKGK